MDIRRGQNDESCDDFSFDSWFHRVRLLPHLANLPSIVGMVLVRDVLVVHFRFDYFPWSAVSVHVDGWI